MSDQHSARLGDRSGDQRSTDAGLSGKVLGPAEPDLAFCHGLFGQGKNWTQIAKALAPEHSSLLLDMPNHGNSAWTDEVDYPAWSDLVAQAIEPHAPLDLIGHSMGGKIAMQVALRHPQLVRRLVIVDIAPVDYGRQSSFPRYVEAMSAIDLRTNESRATAEQTLAASVEDPVIRSFLLQNLRRDGDGWRWQMNLAVLGEQLERLGGWPATESTFDGPTLWVAGEHSDYIKAEDRAQMQQLFPKLRLVTVKGAGHWVHSEQPEAFVHTIRPFLARP